MLTSNCSFLGDIQEPFRWIADVTVIEAFESGLLDLPNFYFTGDDYRYRFENEAKRRFLDLLRERFNSPVQYKDRFYSWDTLIRLKAQELASFILGKRGDLNFSEPKLTMHRTDSEAMRIRILSLTTTEAREVGVGKSSCWYLQRRAKDQRPFTTYSHTRPKLEAKRQTTQVVRHLES